MLALAALDTAGAQVLAGGGAAAARQVALYPVMQGKGATASEVTAPDLAINDAGRKVDSREILISHDLKDDPRPVAFFFDRLDAASAKNAARLAQRILGQIREGAGASGLWALRGQLEMLQPYTADPGLTAKAITASLGEKGGKATTAAAASGSAAATPGPSDARQELLEKMSQEIVARAQRIVAERHVRWDMASLLGFAEAQRLLPGRKAIVYFTEKEPADLKAVDDLKAVTQSLNDASTTLYVVDANPLDAGADEQETTMALGNQTMAIHAQKVAVQMNHTLDPVTKARDLTMGLGTTGFKVMNDKIADLEFDSLQGNESLLERMAAVTGGRSISEEDDAKKISRPLVAGLTNYCKVTYTVSTDELDGKYHPVVMRVTQHGAEGVSQLGYFMPSVNGRIAEPRLSGSGVTERSEMDRLAADATGSELVLHTGVLRFGVSKAGVHEVFALEVPVNDLELQEDRSTGLFSLHASVAAEIRNASGEPVARFAYEFRPHGSLTTEAAFRTQALSTERAIDLPAGEYTLVAVVRDWATGRIGSVEERFATRPEEGDARLSDVVLVRSTEGGGGVGTGTAALQYGARRVVPNLSGEVGAGAGVGEGAGKEGGSASLFFELYPEEAAAGAPSLYLEVSRDGKPATRLPLRLRAGAVRQGSAQVASVNFGAFRGNMDVALCLEQGARVVKRSVAFTVTGPPGGSGETGGKTEPAAEEAAAAAAADAPRAELFDLGTGPAAGPTLSAGESEALIASAREGALSYGKGLPNFLCLEAIERSDDARGTGSWKHHDSIVELLRYQDHLENRSVLEVDGEKSSLSAEQIEGARSNGEFGSMLATIFEPAAEASFVWQKTEEQDGEVLQVFSYKVDQKHSNFYVSDHNGEKMRAAFHGLVFVDGNTRAVRRIVAQTEGLPVKFGVRSSWIAMNYDYIAINRHDYLLPTRGEVGLVQGRQQVVRNELRFSDYRRFGSRSKITYGGAELEAH